MMKLRYWSGTQVSFTLRALVLKSWLKDYLKRGSGEISVPNSPPQPTAREPSVLPYVRGARRLSFSVRHGMYH